MSYSWHASKEDDGNKENGEAFYSSEAKNTSRGEHGCVREKTPRLFELNQREREEDEKEEC